LAMLVIPEFARLGLSADQARAEAESFAYAARELLQARLEEAKP
jgi:hypothetical protein